MDPKASNHFIVSKITENGKRARPFRVDSNELIELLCMSTIGKENLWVITKVKFE